MSQEAYSFEIMLLITHKHSMWIESLSSGRSWGHERLPEVIATTMDLLRMSWRPRGQVADARTPLFRSKVERHKICSHFVYSGLIVDSES